MSARLASKTSIQFNKSKMCPHHMRGACFMGESCGYAHDVSELQSRPNLTKTKMCPKLKTGCANGDNCSFAHSSSELRNTDVYYKTVACWYWDKYGSCKMGAACRHAHGAAELARYSQRSQDVVEMKTSSVKSNASDSTVDTVIRMMAALNTVEGENDSDTRHAVNGQTWGEIVRETLKTEGAPLLTGGYLVDCDSEDEEEHVEYCDSLDAASMLFSDDDSDAEYF